MRDANGTGRPSAAPYDAQAVEAKSQRRWQEAGCFKASSASAGEKFFNFDGGPFPNGPLHMGHVRTFTLGDVMARYQRMRGRRVLYCFEFDAFGLPNELAAEALGVTPQALTHKNIAQMRDQMVRLGLSYDWDHVLTTCDPNYYRWTQWLFLKLRERGLIYRAPAELNWCPSCRTTLAHMQVEDGRCWRCETLVEQRRLTQWFVALSKYSRVLAESLERAEGLGARVRNVLRGFIGEARVVEIDFALRDRPDTILTAYLPEQSAAASPAFLAIAPNHPVLATLLAPESETPANARRPAGPERRRTRSDTSSLFDGFDTGLEVVHPETGAVLPVFVAPHVDATFASGIKVGCPSTDIEDRQFAERLAIALPDAAAPNARLRGRPATHYRVHDWLVSRQRAWGTPIPIVHCERCGEVAVPDHLLPVRLPELAAGMPPGGLAAVPSFAEAACPQCGEPARRETDTLDCYFDVIWCFLACANGLRPDFAFTAADFSEWMPADWFHNGLDSFFYMHLYRFIGRVLHEMGILADPEPIRHYLGHDAVLLRGRKMSKHHGNVVSPDEVIDRVGADVLRVQILWAANPQRSVEWSEEGLKRAGRLVADAWKLVIGQAGWMSAGTDRSAALAGVQSLRLERLTARTIRRVTEFLERYQYGACLQELQGFIARLEGEIGAPKRHADDPAYRRSLADALGCLVRLLAPFAPHAAEEMWERIGGDGLAATAPWPEPSVASPRPEGLPRDRREMHVAP